LVKGTARCPLKAIILTTHKWEQILAELHKEHPPSYFLRWKMKEKLGFTVREHKAWIENKNRNDDWLSLNGGSLDHIVRSAGYTELQIHLDFYSEPKRTFFLLKFSEIITKDTSNELDII
jgi:hypothetical protein